MRVAGEMLKQLTHTDKGGKLRALGVSTTRRIALLPSVPTLDEAGVKGYDMGYRFALSE